MSSDTTPAEPPPPPPAWEPLSPLERRILGVLIEKQKTARSPETYPLTLNALVTGCCQKSNRDPVMELSDGEVEEGLTALQKKQLVMRVTGGRVEKFRHRLYEKWTPNGPEMAVLAELLLRGPQTKGELRGRAGRMDAIDTLDTLDDILKSLARRRLVVYLTDPDRRGAVVTHGFHSPEELAELRSTYAAAPHAGPSTAPPAGLPAASAANPTSAPLPSVLSALEARLAAALADIDTLKGQVAALAAALAGLQQPTTGPVNGPGP
jgi:uncharacterized protein YceH (UPF0502 family)